MAIVVDRRKSKFKRNIQQMVMPMLIVTVIGLIFVISAKAHSKIEHKHEINASLASVEVKAPEGVPPFSNESIKLALELYGIELPSNVKMPTIDKNLTDRGVTRHPTWSKYSEVSVGRSAFTSWALLGATLSHEIEVHCNQNFLLIFLMDRFGLNGTNTAERVAYSHEIAHADRFGLTEYDRQLIVDTKEYFYPESSISPPSNVFSAKLGKWFAKNFLAHKVD